MAKIPKVIIIGAGPAGLTAAYELASSGRAEVTVFEADSCCGGISRTVNCSGNRIDIGGHRFFSKSDTVMRWWGAVMPEQDAPARDDVTLHRQLYTPGPGKADPEKTDEVLLHRPRVSRILYGGKFYSYPVALSLETLANLGVVRTVRIGCSYLWRRLFPVKPERTLEDFFINRFGGELYRTFFRDYTEKVWGVPCAGINSDWGAQRVKGLSISRAVLHALGKAFGGSRKNVETSLIDRFLYPKLGPGQLWEKVAALAGEKGVKIHYRHCVTGINMEQGKIKSLLVKNMDTGEVSIEEGDEFISTMPVRELVAAMDVGAVPQEARRAAAGLEYRAFVTAGLLYSKITAKNTSKIPTLPGLVPDTWIYVQEPQVKVGRLQIFNNWSHYLAAKNGTVWLGLEFFCQEDDEFWRRPDEQISALAAKELQAIGFADESDLLYSAVVRMPKTYPGYFGAYSQFPLVRAFLDSVPNLYPVGRNGMHRYNNMDHSMLTAMKAAQIILGSGESKDAIWAINSEEEYHESK